MELGGLSWYVVMTNARMEKVCAEDIRSRGYEAIYLHTSEWVAGDQRRKSRLIVRPHLPRYIFVGLTPEQFVDGVPVLHEVTAARGFSGFAPGGVPMRVPLSDMKRITASASLPSGLVMSRSEDADRIWQNWLKSSPWTQGRLSQDHGLREQAE